MGLVSACNDFPAPQDWSFMGMDVGAGDGRAKETTASEKLVLDISLGRLNSVVDLRVKDVEPGFVGSVPELVVYYAESQVLSRSIDWY